MKKIEKAREDVKQFLEDAEGTDFYEPSSRFGLLWLMFGICIGLLGWAVSG